MADLSLRVAGFVVVSMLVLGCGSKLSTTRVVYLRSGTTLRGDIVTTRADTTVMNVDDGRTATIRNDAIVRIAPEMLRYQTGMTPPPGYHLEERPRTGMIIGGAILTGLGAVFLISAGFAQYPGIALFFASGAGTPGVVLLIVGLASHRRYWQLDGPEPSHPDGGVKQRFSFDDRALVRPLVVPILTTRF
jgi:hypothetical protein